MGFRFRHQAGTPDCPICDGPCADMFPRSEYVFPDRLPEAKDGSADPKPKPVRKPNRRGRRPEHAPVGPSEDRARKPSEDR